MAYLHEHYSTERQLAQYAEVILNAQVAAPPEYRHPVRDGSTLHILAPWCYRSPRGIYHDFRADYANLGALDQVLQELGSVTRDAALQAGVPEDEFERRYEQGYIVPV